MFITKYIPDVRFEYHERNLLITTVVDGSIFRTLKRYYFYPGNKMMKLKLTLKHINKTH